MTRSRRIFLFLIAVAGILATLLAILVLLAPRLLDSKTVRDLVVTELERKAGVRISFARADLAIFPRPRIVVEEATFDLPGVAQGKIPRLTAAPELLPLLLGKVRVGGLLLEGAELRVNIPPAQKPAKAFSAEELEGKIASILAALEKSAPAAVVSIRNGRLDLSDADGPIVSLRDLNARAGLPPERMTLSARCRSEYWDGLSIDTSLRPEGLRGDTGIEAERFRIGDLVERLAPGAAPWLGETVLTLRGRIASGGLQSGKVEFAGGVPVLTVRRGARSRAFRVDSFKGSAEWTGKGLKAALPDLSIDDPRVRLSGGLTVDRDPPAVKARLEGREADIPSIRSAILALAGDVPAVRVALGVVRGGTLSRFSLETGGKSPRELADFGSFKGRATLSGGTITVPGIDLALNGVGGEASLSGGILAGESLTARLGKSSARGGTLRMGFAGKDAPFRLEVTADADIGELQPLLRRLVPDERFRGEIDRIREARGSVSGRLTLGERLSSIRPVVALSAMDFSGKYDRLPFPVAIRGGRASYDGKGLEATDLRGSIGGSTVSALTGRLGFGETPSISIRGGRVRAALGELYPWVASLEGFRDAVKEVRSVRGFAEFTALSCEGPLREPGKWRFDAGGTVEGVEASSPLLPGPVTIPRGRFRMTPEELSLTEAEASLADTTARGDVRLHGYRDGVDRVDASLRGDVGVEAAEWAYARFGVPQPFALKAPFALTGSKLSWRKDGGSGVEASLAWPEGPDISLSLRKTPGTLSVDPLVIRDKASDVKASFRLDPGAAKMRFAGTLSRSTIEKVVPIRVMPGQRIRGEMEAVLDRGKPARSTARGKLEANDLAIPWKPLAPLVIRGASLSADGGKVRLASSDLSWDNVPFSLTGTAEFGGETVVADLDISAGDIDAEKLMRSIFPESPAKPETGAPAMRESRGAQGFPVRGVLRVRADSVSKSGLTWQKVRGEADIGAKGLRISVSEANLCGISTPGTFSIDSAGPAVEMAASTAGENLDATIACLSGKEVSLTGKYSLSARVAGKGTGDALVRSLRGPLELTVRDGRINKMTFLSRILTYLNVTEILKGKLPDLEKEGFPYKTFAIRGEMEDGKVLLKEVTMDAPSMGVVATGEVDLLSGTEDLMVLISPFRTVDVVVRNIPVVGYILGGTLVTIPVTVKGDIRKPTVTPMDPKAVGRELLGILERTLKAPVHVFSPTSPADQEK